MKWPLSLADKENRRGCFIIILSVVALLLVIVFLAMQREDKPESSRVVVTETS